MSNSHGLLVVLFERILLNLLAVDEKDKHTP